jgi:hypothetical protein
MSRVEEIKAAIDRLSPEERCELTALLNSAEEACMRSWPRHWNPEVLKEGNYKELLKRDKLSVDIFWPKDTQRCGELSVIRPLLVGRPD